jgi:hypothetical protein
VRVGASGRAVVVKLHVCVYTSGMAAAGADGSSGGGGAQRVGAWWRGRVGNGGGEGGWCWV